MTEVSSTTPTVFVPRGRPVVRFVAAIALVSAALTVVWATGLFNPRVEVALDRWTMSGGDGEAVVVIRNEGPTQAHVRVEELNDPFAHFTSPIVELHIGPGKEGRVELPFTVDCDAYETARRSSRGATDPSLRLVVRARGALGPGHLISWSPSDEVDLAAACR